MKNKKYLWICAILVIALGLGFAAGCSSEKTEDQLEKIVVTLDWTPNTNHTGLYVAKDNGYYEEAGLDVEIVQLSGGSVEQVVASESSHFGVAYQEGVTYARLSDIPIVSIAAVIQHNTSGFASLKSKGIETPKDFEGKKYGGWGSPVEEATIKALMDRYEADYSQVEILTTGAVDFFVSSEKNADFSWIYSAWDGVAAEIRGVELNYIDLGTIDPALDYYTPVLITSESLINEDPELVEKFMKATAKGYEFAIEQPEQAASILLANAPELDEELVIASQIWLKDKYQDDAEMWGLQQKEVWQNYTNWLSERDLIEGELDVDKAFTNQFIN
ncbi:MAG: ABC transporter substrate-binding protein [Desulfitibacter sp. BRH_c19]|nr:MAG: ABC transporter substrate-binding protein [Desulfitibacter sp. BRH_c19]